MTIKPQPGPQQQFLGTPADVALTGGGAGGGKTWGLLLEGLRHAYNPHLRYTLFRRTYQQITQQGGLWDEAAKLYGRIGGATSIESPPTWHFPEGGEVQMRHLQYEKDRFQYQGAQIPLIGFDELTHFSEQQFFYLLSRNRSANAGFSPYVRATCNPDPSSWVRSFIDWWIGSDGFPIPERSGTVRYFMRGPEDGFLWGESRQELVEGSTYAQEQVEEMERELRETGIDADAQKLLIKSFTFIPSTVQDNPALLKNNPQYLANLRSQDKVTRKQLLKGNWDVVPAAGLYFKEHYFPTLSPDREDIDEVVRYWDMAATEPHDGNKDPDYLAGCLLGELSEPAQGTEYVVLDIERHRESPGEVKSIVKSTAEQDAEAFGRDLKIRMEQEPGSAGKSQIHDYESVLSDYDFEGDKVTGDKVTRAEAPSAAAEPTEERPAREIGIVEAPWNGAFIQELEQFPEGDHDDQVDALSGAYNTLGPDTEAQRRRNAFSTVLN
jgi:predicted phage terminase large subunit-like protein